MFPEGHVVLVHAFPLNATLWRPQIDRAPTGWRFITPDLPGFAPDPFSCALGSFLGELQTSR